LFSFLFFFLFVLSFIMRVFLSLLVLLASAVSCHAGVVTGYGNTAAPPFDMQSVDGVGGFWTGRTTFTVFPILANITYTGYSQSGGAAQTFTAPAGSWVIWGGVQAGNTGQFSLPFTLVASLSLSLLLCFSTTQC